MAFLMSVICLHPFTCYTNVVKINCPLSSVDLLSSRSNRLLLTPTIGTKIGTNIKQTRVTKGLQMKPRQPKAKGKHGQKQRGDKKVERLVFDPSERIDFVKGFQKRKQERRERAKQEAAEQEREVRKLLRQKRREALKRAQLSASAGHGNEADEEMKSDDDDGGGVEGAGEVGAGNAEAQLAPTLSADTNHTE